MVKQPIGSFSLPFPIQQLHLTSDLDNLFNKGRVPIATWTRNILPQIYSHHQRAVEILDLQKRGIVEH
ncbi:hypothetical protein Syun_025227 [Stephania yunnanensis]|uniref:Uncharacterized protein n=1 Tax=Stephania yunnanensis TaxID=152371 RepID=A0AAP0EU72_9MAGN